MNPLVSVIIPCFNAEKTLKETIESVLSQTYAPIEIIVIDDGSSDNSVDIAKLFGDQIIVLQKENGGPASARNAGIRLSRGMYIAFVDADDLWLPAKLNKQISVMEKDTSLGLTFTGYQRFIGDDTARGRDVIKPYGKGTFFTQIYLGQMAIATLTVVVRRDALQAVGEFDERPEIQGAEDFDLWLRIADRYEFAYIAEILACYRESFDGHNRSNIERAYSSSRNVVEKHRSLMIDKYKATKKDFRNLYFKSNFNQGLTYFDLKNNKSARLFFFKSLCYRIFSIKSITYLLLSCINRGLLDTIKNNKTLILFKKVILNRAV